MYGLFYWLGRRFDPEEIARNAAKAMLRSFRAFESKFPGAPKEELYMRALMTRLTFRTQTRAEMVVQYARFTAAETGQPVRLWMVVLWVVLHEYDGFKALMSGLPGRMPETMVFFEPFQAGVRQVISDDI
jgi:hypothetical protein